MRKSIFICSLLFALIFASSAQAEMSVSMPLYESPGGAVPVIVTVYNPPSGYKVTITARSHSGAKVTCTGPNWRNPYFSSVSRKCYLFLPLVRSSYHVNTKAYMTRAGYPSVTKYGRSSRAMEANGYLSRTPMTLLRMQQIEKCHNQTDKVWLTFDDGGSPSQVRSILSTLRANHVKGRFFFTGKWAREYPALFRQIKNEGHVIGNHTYSHVALSRHSNADVLWQIKNGTIGAPKLLRPPYAAGVFTTRLQSLAASRGHTLCRWTTDTYDWQGPTGTQMARRVKYGDHMTPPIRKGGNILMHGSGQYTASGLQKIINAVRGRGLVLDRL